MSKMEIVLRPQLSQTGRQRLEKSARLQGIQESVLRALTLNRLLFEVRNNIPASTNTHMPRGVHTLAVNNYAGVTLAVNVQEKRLLMYWRPDSPAKAVRIIEVEIEAGHDAQESVLEAWCKNVTKVKKDSSSGAKEVESVKDGSRDELMREFISGLRFLSRHTATHGLPKQYATAQFAYRIIRLMVDAPLDAETGVLSRNVVQHRSDLLREIGITQSDLEFLRKVFYINQK